MDPEADKISCRNLSWTLDAFADRGLEVRLLLEDLSFSEEHIRDPSRFIDWAGLTTLCQNFGRAMGDLDVIECGKRSIRHPIFRVLRVPAKLIYEVEDLYRFLVRPDGGHIPRSYPPLRTSIVNLGPNSLAVEVTTQDGFEPIREWQLMLLGQLIALPGVLGLPEAEVLMTEVGRGARYRVTTPRSGRAPLAALRRAFTVPFIARAAAAELLATNRILEEKYRTLELEMEQRSSAEAALAENDARYRLLAEHVHDVIWTTDLNLRYTYVSPSAEEVLGHSVQDAPDLPPGAGLTPESFELVKAVLAEEIEADGTAPGERSRTLKFEVVLRDGSTRWVEVNASFLRDEDGRPSGVVGVTRDVTERRKVADQLRQAQRMESIGHLAGGVAHDFNNLLAVVQGYTELALEHPDLPEEVHEQLKEVKLASDRATHLTTQLLTFGRRQQIQFLPIDLGELIDGLRSMLERLIPKNLEQRFDLEPGTHILGDPGQIEQVIVNFVVNARDASANGGTLRFETRNVVLEDDSIAPDARAGVYVRLRIADTGSGMTREVESRIFDPFFTTKPEGQGTGLGLSVALGIVSQHGGFITVESELGVGTEFSIYLPRTSSAPVQPVHEGEGHVRGGTETILLVEDEPAVRQLSRQILEGAGYTVRTAADGAAAVADFEANLGQTDLVLLDIVMPTMSGRQVQERMHEIAPGIPVVFVSGYVGDGVHTDFVADLGLELISKPYAKRTLLRKVREILDAR